MIGTELGGRYVVERALGRGGMGHVYQALDRQLGRRVAVKLLHDERNDPSATERFVREARSAASLEHPHACRLYELGEHQGQTFLVMELLEGELLSERLLRGAMPMAEAIDVLLPLMDAVGALHCAGLIHRDLKPSNVFLTEQGVKLLDFGLARHTRPETALTAPSLTMAGAVAGTLRYMAPEQVTGDPVDELTDVFALGVMFYEMLTGHIPFNAATNVDWLNAVLREDPQPLNQPGLEPIEPVIRRALQRRSADRFASVGEMSSALSSVVAAGPIVPSPAPSNVPRRPAGYHRGPAVPPASGRSRGGVPAAWRAGGADGGPVVRRDVARAVESRSHAVRRGRRHGHDRPRAGGRPPGHGHFPAGRIPGARHRAARLG